MTSSSSSADHDPIRAVATLADQVRRRLFDYASTAGRPVSRDEAAAAVGISRKLAAFHLDKLAGVGLLRSRFQMGGIPRVGRRPKVYEPAGLDIQVSIPARRHEILADILVRSVLAVDGRDSVTAAAARVAYGRGHEAGVAVRVRARPGRLGAERGLTLAEAVLAEHGFEPVRVGPNRIRLRNCPFCPVAESAPQLVCKLNHAFARGILDGLQAHTVAAALAPVAGECCVELRGADSK